ncbi:hypothetical protein [Mycoplasmopsis agassizii]|uniref:Lipoprotein n=1 Tax=Mycoplasmopsis agassizii TaxID=33922 RepID=A0ABX4H4V4_9BACT|nr:hypothetical protein [Mycoplasmopsis agassizii]PAF54914.1 hypothetical protein CJF60_04215 [Mycoplasmopsis agassizii]SMC17166.1 hypothetical protein SAMN02745179_00409 [Mycoplasmopsis agassizii]
MLFNKKLMLSVVTLVALGSASLAISCTTAKSDPTEGINLNTQMQKTSVFGKEVLYSTLNNSVTEKIYGKTSDKLHPVLLKTTTELDEFLAKRKASFLSLYESDKKIQDELSISKTALEENLDSYTKEMSKAFNDEYFNSNIMVVDFGGKISAKGEKINHYLNNHAKITNLLDISVVNDKITITYDANSDAKSNVQYSVFYSLNKKTFDLKNENYEIVKEVYDRNKKTAISNRMLTVSSFITQDLSKHQRSENSEWTKNTAYNNFSSIILKTKQQLSDLLDKFALFYKTQYSKEFPVSEKEAILSTYNDDYFAQNYLVLLSAFHYPSLVSLFSDNIEESFDVKIDNNELIFTMFISKYNVQDIVVEPDYVEFKNESKDQGKGNNNSGDQQHTLFFKLPKNLVTNEENLKVRVDSVRSKYT